MTKPDVTTMSWSYQEGDSWRLAINVNRDGLDVSMDHQIEGCGLCPRQDTRKAVIPIEAVESLIVWLRTLEFNDES